MDRNKATVVGEIINDAELSHEMLGERFYLVKVKAKRTSGYEDVIPILISNRIADIEDLNVGKVIEVTGQFRSYNKPEGGKSKLILLLFAKELVVFESTKHDGFNVVFLDGYICKEPVYRITPMGREIADVLLAVNRAYSKSDYIPCICWGRNARYAERMSVGTHVKIRGRIQSREYSKQITEDYAETKTAYEVSISQMEVVESEKCKDQVDNAE